MIYDLLQIHFSLLDNKVRPPEDLYHSFENSYFRLRQSWRDIVGIRSSTNL